MKSTLLVLRRGWPATAAFAVAVLCLSVTPLPAQQYWFETYERAVDLVDNGESGRAAPMLESLIQDHPVPVSCLRVPGDRCLDYLPYFHRARVQVSQGDLRGATHSLDVEAAFGAVFRNRRTERAYTKLREDIRNLGLAPARNPARGAPTAQ